MIRALFFICFVFIAPNTFAAGVSGIPSLPTSGGAGMQGSVGIGFTDFNVLSPSDDFKIDRGTFIAATIERSFNVLHLYLTMSLSHMNAEGLANYNYTNLSSSTSYTATDVAFKAKMFDLGLGLKMKLIDEYWFRPYIEVGGLGGYDEVNYTGKTDVLNAQGSDYKKKDIIMGSGFYGEGGFEIQFGERFGVKIAGRYSEYRTKELETLNKRNLWFRSETYYLAALFGF